MDISSVLTVLSGFILAFNVPSIVAHAAVPTLLFQNEGGNVVLERGVIGHKLSADAFSTVLDGITNLPDIAVIFVQDELSGEDFLLPDKHMRSGGLLKHLKKYTSRPGTFYYPSVKSPYHSLKTLAARYDELIELKDNDEAVEYISRVNLQINTAVVIHLSPTATDPEKLSKSLRHNDEIIGKVIQHLDEIGMSYVAAFSAKSHRNKGESETVVQASGRHLLVVKKQIDTDSKSLVINNTCIVYIESVNISVNGSLISAQGPDIDIKCEATNGTNGTFSRVAVTLTADSSKVKLEFTKRNQMAKLTRLSVGDAELSKREMALLYMDVPLSFSYHCSSLSIDAGNSTTAKLQGLQVQVFQFRNGRFGNAYDCVGFFTLPIWTALLLTLLLIGVTIFGLGMLSSISTFDRYDDPRAAPLAINISE